MLGCLTNEHYDLTRVCARAHVCVCSLHKPWEQAIPHLAVDK